MSSSLLKVADENCSMIFTPEHMSKDIPAASYSPLVNDILIKFVQNLNKLAESSEDNKFRYINQLHALLADYRVQIKASGMMNQSLAAVYFLSLGISNSLVNDQGEINLRMIPSIIAFLNDPVFSTGTTPPEWLKNMKRQLGLLQQPENGLFEIINHIQVNPSAPKICQLMTTAALRIPSNTEMTDAMLKRVLILSMIGVSPQVETNDCQARWAPRAQKWIIPKYVLNDFGTMLHIGAISRVFNGEEIKFLFPYFLACDSIRYNIVVDPSGVIQPGQILQPDGHLSIKIWDAIPMQAAFLQMGITPTEELNNKVLQELFRDGSDSVSTCAQKLIAIYAEMFDPENCKSLIQLGCFGFAATRNNVLEDLLISGVMTAGTFVDGPSPIKWVSECIANTFKKQRNLLITNESWAGSIKNHTWNILSRTTFGLISNAAIDVDPIIESVTQVFQRIAYYMYAQKQAGGEGRWGENILYYNPANSDPDKVEKKGTAEGFREVVLAAIELAQKEAMGKNSKIKGIASEIFDRMKTYVRDGTFVKDAEIAFVDVYRTYAKDPSKGTTQTSPWKFFENEMRNMVRPYLTDKGPQPEIFVRASHAGGKSGVLDWFMQKVAGVDTMSLDPNINPIAYNGTVSGGFLHSFNWLLFHESLVGIKQYMEEQKCTWQMAYNALVTAPAIKLQNTPIDISEMNQFFEMFKIEMEKNASVPVPSLDLDSINDESSTEMREYIKSLFKAVSLRILPIDVSFEAFIGDHKPQLTIGQFSQTVINILNQKCNPDNNPLVNEVIEGFVTTVILRRLSPENYQQLYFLQIADTNWINSVHGEGKIEPRDIHFFISTSLVNGEIIFGMCNDDGTFPLLLPITKHLGSFNLDLRSIPENRLV